MTQFRKPNGATAQKPEPPFCLHLTKATVRTSALHTADGGGPQAMFTPIPCQGQRCMSFRMFQQPDGTVGGMCLLNLGPEAMAELTRVVHDIKELLTPAPATPKVPPESLTELASRVLATKQAQQGDGR